MYVRISLNDYHMVLEVSNKIIQRPLSLNMTFNVNTFYKAFSTNESLIIDLIWKCLGGTPEMEKSQRHSKTWVMVSKRLHNNHIEK